MTKNNIIDKILLLFTWTSAALVFTTLIFIIAYILVGGLPHFSLSLFEMTYNSQNVSMMPSIISTVLIVLLTLAIALPLGMFTGIYLIEYTKRGNKLVGLVRRTAELLASIPSIVYGLFGLLFFVEFLGFGFSIIAGSLTLAIMILPLIIRTTEEALKSVSDGLREGAFALGSGKLRAVFKIVLPSAMPGILAGIILAIGRIVGESAALIFTAGTVAQIPMGFEYSTRTLAVHMWALSGEAFHVDAAYATAVTLLAIVVIINTISAIIAKRLSKI